MCLHMWAHWRHMANTIELVLPSHPLPKSTIQTANQSVRPSLHNSRQNVPIRLLIQWALLFPKVAPSDGGMWTPSNTWFLGPTRVLNPNGISVDSAIFAGLIRATDRLTDRPTDHATPSVTIDRIYIHSMGDAFHVDRNPLKRTRMSPKTRKR